jgi:hypothetical protein
MTKTQSTETLTITDLDRMANDDRWLGFGYLGERGHAANESPETAALVDAHVIEIANGLGMSYDDLFQWANSKDGRWYGDMTFGQATGYAVTTTFPNADKYGPRA